MGFVPRTTHGLNDFDNAGMLAGDGLRWDATAGKFKRSSVFNDQLPASNLGRIGPLPAAWPGSTGNPQSATLVDHLMVNANGGNVLTIMQTDSAGFSAIRFCDETGTEYAAYGQGNSACGHPYQARNFRETYSRTANTYVPMIDIHSIIEGANDYRRYSREVNTLGEIREYNITNPAVAPAEVTCIDSGGFRIRGTNGVLVQDDGGGNCAGRIRFFDDNCQIVGRDGVVNVMSFYSYGGASASTLGHRFLTGGVKASQTEKFKISDDASVFNEPGADVDFRVESDTNAHALFVDAGVNRVGILNSSPAATLDVTGDIKLSGSLIGIVENLRFSIDGGGSAITTGSKMYSVVDFACAVEGWTILADQSGSIAIDVKRATYANFPTFGSIAGSEKPTLSAAQKNQDLTLSTWTTALAAGDVLEFVVDSATTVTKAVVILKVRRT